MVKPSQHFPVLLSPTLATGISSDVADSVHDTNPRNNSVTKERFDHDLHTATSLMITDHHIQEWAHLRDSTDPPFYVG